MLVAGADVDEDSLAAALSGGDVAGVIVSPIAADGARLDEAAFADRAQSLVSGAQSAGVAALVAYETRVAGRVGADGVHLESLEARADAERLSRDMSVGVGNVNDRDVGLAVGEWPIDYIFFGPLHRDVRPEPHRRNLKLAAWWSEVVALPCVVMGGNVVESVVDVAATGADFVALQTAVFGADIGGAGEAVAQANRLLDEHAPPFTDD